MASMGRPRPRQHAVSQRVQDSGRSLRDFPMVRAGRQLEAVLPRLGVHPHGLHWSHRYVHDFEEVEDQVFSHCVFAL